MDHIQDPRIVIGAMHHCATRDLLGLMDGFYSNLEDGLFELSYRTRNKGKHRVYFDLMRQMRHAKSRMVAVFIDQLQTSLREWFDDDATPMNLTWLRQARILAQNSAAHYEPLLNEMAERAGQATGCEINGTSLPLSPLKIAYHFLYACREVDFDEESIVVVQDLFRRFVLERLGSVYGQCHGDLKKAGYQSLGELAILEEQGQG